MKNLQKFSDEYLQRCMKLSIEERMNFIENYKLAMSDEPSPLKSIRIKIPDYLHIAFKQKANLEGVAYQTQIKKLMKQWIN
jgi:predicted DNA binding CopG/RHH family protein